MSVNLKPANLLNVDYEREAARFDSSFKLIDVHSHINGKDAAKIYQKAARLYGVTHTYSMTYLEQVDTIKQILGESISFISIPEFAGADLRHSHGPGYSERIRVFHKKGARIAKFFAAPRIIEMGVKLGDPNLLKLNSPLRIETMKVAHDLGMIFMTHVADPNTWFQTRYADTKIFGTKISHYEALEECLEQFKNPWIGAHMGGFPEDLDFLSKLLEKHSNFYLDTSATKWQVRELSKHPREKMLAFFTKWKGRILFGSDIVSSDQHLNEATNKSEMEQKAANSTEAFDLYASRYYALRTLFETNYSGQSPIADPDLKMLEPTQYTEFDSPRLEGKAFPKDLLNEIYFGAANKLFK